MPGKRIVLILLPWLAFLLRMEAQIDPEHRQLVHLGYNQPLEGRGPIAGYAFYYHNEPKFFRENLTLRAAVAPTYLDSELGIARVLTPGTDLGIGLAGGGFADNYSEVRQGNLRQDESFTGYGGQTSFSLYHTFNPLPEGRTAAAFSEIPLQAVLRNTLRYSTYETSSKTAADFVIPDDKVAHHLRAGLRWGGREPLMEPAMAGELSAWYEGQFRADSPRYGFDRDREIEAQTHLFWCRALAAYTFSNSQRFEISVTAGTTVNPDRFSSYRPGGALPLGAEFPLMLPGYYSQELTSERFSLIAANYSVPLAEQFHLLMFGSTAWVDYLTGLEQPGNWHSGIGGGLGWIAPSGSWHIMVGYGFGMDAIRDGDRGAHNVSLIVQWDLERGGLRLPDIRKTLRTINPGSLRGGDQRF